MSGPGGPISNTMTGAIYLTGNVILDDGTAPPEPVTIEKVCSGAPKAQAYTDQKGRFSFQIGHTAGVIQDASEAGSGMSDASHSASSPMGGGPSQSPGSAEMQLANCDLRAVLSGFRSDSVSLGTRRSMDDPNVGTIFLHRLSDVEGSAISLTSLTAPKVARQAYTKALQYEKKEKLPDALKQLQKAVELDLQYAAAWYELGRLQMDSGDSRNARAAFTQAIAADGKFVSPYLPLAELEAKEQNWSDLAGSTARLIKLDARDYPMAYFYNAVANAQLGQLDAAEKSAVTGEKLDTAHHNPRFERVLATILTRKRDFSGAAAHLRSYLMLVPDAADAPQMRKDLAEMERLSGVNEQTAAARSSS